MKKCRKCHKEIPTDVKFYPECGANTKGNVAKCSLALLLIILVIGVLWFLYSEVENKKEQASSIKQSKKIQNSVADKSQSLQVSSSANREVNKEQYKEQKENLAKYIIKWQKMMKQEYAKDPVVPGVNTIAMNGVKIANHNKRSTWSFTFSWK